MTSLISDDVIVERKIDNNALYRYADICMHLVDDVSALKKLHGMNRTTQQQ